MNQYRDFSNLIKPILEQQDILLDEPMKNHTSFKVGGPCDVFVTPRNYDQVIDIIKLCVREKVPYYIVGNGSNLLVKDGGIRGVVVNTSKLSNIEVNGEEIVVECGAMLSTVSKRAASAGLAGLEFASGIPGSIGGAVAMNAGAYDGEISQVIKSALIVNKIGEIKELSKEELELSYRKSAIFKNGYTVLRVAFKLKKGDKDKIMNRIKELTIKRTERQPLEYPSAGSTFKRPEGHFTGRLIEDTGLKGASIGGAQVSEKHAGFVINKENAKAKDILDLINLVQMRVEEKFGVRLQPEVRIIGED